MKSLLKAIVFSLLLGSASLAMAQDATSTVNINTANAIEFVDTGEGAIGGAVFYDGLCLGGTDTG
ncbi:hypothetical protein BIS07_01295, partial [Halomonas sp. FL8]|nr:hypothetical protein [Halomonas sp. FL8]